MSATTTRATALAAADAVVLLVLRPRWDALAGGLAHPRAWLAAVPDAALATATGALLWLVAVWVAIGLTAQWGARLPGTVGRLSGRCAQVVVPRVLLRVVIGSTGLGLLAAPAAAPVAARPPAVGVALTSSAPATSAWQAASTWLPAPTWPVGASADGARTLPPPTPPTSDSSTQRVRPGDSLWLLAARRLGTHAGRCDVAHYWPQVYGANRSVVGDDPSVIHPGQVLDLPAPTQESR